MKKNIIITLVSILVVAGLGTLFTQLGMKWFDGLNKPTEWIPSFVIPIVWTVIYLLFVYVLIKWQNKISILSIYGEFIRLISNRIFVQI